MHNRELRGNNERGACERLETFGRGCLYLILGVVALTIIAFLTRSTINISWFVIIPVVILVFWLASKQSRK